MAILNKSQVKNKKSLKKSEKDKKKTVIKRKKSGIFNNKAPDRVGHPK